MTLATPSAGRKPLIANSGNFSLPNIVFDYPYFTKEKRVFSRLEALAWIAKHVRWTDNCVLKKGQGTWSLRYLAEAWGWLKPKVQRFLKKLESMNLIRTVSDAVSDTAQTVITYLFSTIYKDAEEATDTAPIQERYSSEPKTNTGKPDKEERDSCPPQASDEFDRAFPGPAPEAVSSSSTPPPNPRPSRAAEFEPIWKAMPPMARKRGSKQEALKEWCKLNGEERVDAARGVKFWERNEFAMAAERWLKKRMWVSLLELELEPAGAQSRASKW